MSLPIKDAAFITTAVKPSGYPPPGPPEVAFAGRSNVGKSSLINALTRRKKLVKVSGRPGRTQHINFFAINNDLIAPGGPAGLRLRQGAQGGQGGLAAHGGGLFGQPRDPGRGGGDPGHPPRAHGRRPHAPGLAALPGGAAPGGHHQGGQAPPTTSAPPAWPSYAPPWPPSTPRPPPFRQCPAWAARSFGPASATPPGCSARCSQPPA